MYNISTYKKAILHAVMKKNDTSLKNCSITETMQATVYSFKKLSKAFRAFGAGVCTLFDKCFSYFLK